tara:strand:+ start:275 stop:472 length:198 start_codon:yes stop_codon:yes gene_type:complete
MSTKKWRITMSKYKIGDQVELNYEFNNAIVIIEEFDFKDEKEIALSKDNWFYFNQIRKIIKKGSK